MQTMALSYLPATDAAYTVPAGEYSIFTIIRDDAYGRPTMTFPHPSSLARSFWKNIHPGTGVSITISTGTGTITAGDQQSRHLLEFTNGGPALPGPEYVL